MSRQRKTPTSYDITLNINLRFQDPVQLELVSRLRNLKTTGEFREVRQPSSGYSDHLYLFAIGITRQVQTPQSAVSRSTTTIIHQTKLPWHNPYVFMTLTFTPSRKNWLFIEPFTWLVPTGRRVLKKRDFEHHEARVKDLQVLVHVNACVDKKWI